MKAMILAAGYGRRMRPLTDVTPKPLLCVGGKPLLQYHLESLVLAGITDVVINVAHLGEQIVEWVGDGSRFGAQVTISAEPRPLETAGAISRALPFLGDEPFVLLNGDVWTEYPLSHLIDRPLAGDCMGHLVLVQNPAHNPRGDFGVINRRLVPLAGAESAAFAAQAVAVEVGTYSGVALLSPQLIADYPERREAFPLREVFQFALERQALSAELYRGQWCDVGTPERLSELDLWLRTH